MISARHRIKSLNNKRRSPDSAKVVPCLDVLFNIKKIYLISLSSACSRNGNAELGFAPHANRPHNLLQYTINIHKLPSQLSTLSK